MSRDLNGPPANYSDFFGRFRTLLSRNILSGPLCDSQPLLLVRMLTQNADCPCWIWLLCVD